MLTVILEAYNEEKNIKDTLERLKNQIDDDGTEIRKDLYRIVVVLSKKSDDRTESIIEEFMKENPSMEMYIVKDNGTGFVDARLFGINFISDNLDDVTEYIAVCDADLVVPEQWVYTILSIFQNTDNEVISFAGTFPNSFWKQVPKLAKKYYEEVGTVFFNADTVDYYGFNGNCLFSEELFQKFGRPVSGGCYAIRKSTYHKNGGYKKEFVDAEQKYELDGPTWRMMFGMYRKNVKIYYCSKYFFECSERRMVANPEEFFSIKDYDKMNIMENYRDVNEAMYQRLDSMVDYIDFQPIRYYVTEYYIFLWCINKIELLSQNREYFGEYYEEIYSDILSWREKRNEPSSLQVFEFAHKINEKYAEKLLINWRK